MTPPGKFGKLPARPDARTIPLGSVLSPRLVQPPPSLGWTQRVAGWGMLGNDRYGNCVEAAVLHQAMLWAFVAQRQNLSFTDADALAAYRQLVPAFDPNNPATDTGTVYVDAMRAWRKTGLAGHRIWAWGSVDWRNKRAVQSAIYALGGVQIGIQFPDNMDFSRGYWLRGGGGPGWQPNPLHGHAIVAVDYDPNWLWGLTWGGLIALTWDFLYTYADECYGAASEDWQADPVTPSGLSLEAAADALGQQLEQVAA